MIKRDEVRKKKSIMCDVGNEMSDLKCASGIFSILINVVIDN